MNRFNLECDLKDKDHALTIEKHNVELKNNHKDTTFRRDAAQLQPKLIQ